MGPGWGLRLSPGSGALKEKVVGPAGNRTGVFESSR